LTFRNGTKVTLKEEYYERYPMYVGIEGEVTAAEHNEGDTALQRIKVRLPDGRERWFPGKYVRPV